MSERVIIVTSQNEMDRVPHDFDGVVEINSKPNEWIVVKDASYVRVVGSSWVSASGNSSVVACDSAYVRAYDDSCVVAYDSARVYAFHSSRVAAHDYSKVMAESSSNISAYGNAQVIARGYSKIQAYSKARVEAYDFARVEAYNTTSVSAYKHSYVVAYDYSRVKAYDFAQVKAVDEARVEAYGFAQVMAYNWVRVIGHGNARLICMSDEAKLYTTENACIVTPPQTAKEYVDHYGIEVRDGYAILYKAVDRNLCAFYDKTFKYRIGETVTAECDPSPNVSCSKGLHVAYKNWAIKFGMENFEDGKFRLLEVAVPLDKIVVPRHGDGKVRTSELKVLREVPKEEWDFYSTWPM